MKQTRCKGQSKIAGDRYCFPSSLNMHHPGTTDKICPVYFKKHYLEKIEKQPGNFMTCLLMPNGVLHLFRTACLIILMLLHASGLSAHKYSITHFDRDNGFPGNKVYHVFQDSRNYIWMGTENGLVSFNGYAFKTYTTADGLPDNDVFKINEDALGRLWIITFSNELCYLWKGAIFNAHNSALVRGLHINGFPHDDSSVPVSPAQKENFLKLFNNRL